jgi:hypothetical protein
VTPKISWIDFNSEIEMGKMFCRFQEYYESPRFVGQVFSIRQYAAWYRKTYGAFTYYRDWEGYNIPARIMVPFAAGRFNPLTKSERTLLQVTNHVPYEGYLVATVNGNLRTLKHELAHALFGTEHDYEAEVLSILGKCPLLPIFQILEKYAYGAVTWVDEAHAYLLESPNLLAQWGLNIMPYKKAVRDLQKVFDAWTPRPQTAGLDPWTLQ